MAQRQAQQRKQSSRSVGSAKGARGSSSNKAKPAYHKQKQEVQPRTLLDERTKRDIASVALIILAIALFATVLFSSNGVVTGALAMALRFSLGIGMYVLPVLLVILGVTFLIRFQNEMVPARVAVGFALLFIAFLTIVSLFTPGAEQDPNVLFAQVYLVNHGGYLGAGIAWAGLRLFGTTVSIILMVGLIVIALIIIGFSLSSLYERIKNHYEDKYEPSDEPRYSDSVPKQSFARIRRLPHFNENDVRENNEIADPHNAHTQVLAKGGRSEAPTQLLDDKHSTSRMRSKRFDAGSEKQPTQSNQDSLATIQFTQIDPEDLKTATITRKLRSKQDSVHGEQAARAEKEEKPVRKKVSDTASPHPLEGFELPDMSLLNTTKGKEVTKESEASLRSTGMLLQDTLADFGVPANVVGWVHGPTVTLFKVELPSGVRVNRVSNLTDDIALALAAPGVRIFAPIPGTNYVGIEVPNKKREMVLLGDVLKHAPKGPLQVAIGKDVEGNCIVSDLATMPHLLIGGTTGSGKSVSINGMIMSILMRATPAEVRMIMIDPKRVEFTPYNGIPHLYVPVVTESKEAASALSWAVAEMERRLKVFSGIGARNIGQYNAKVHQGLELNDEPAKEMPYIVIIIDELADLMMNVGKEVEFSISRLAQLARAAGIHLIVATQRPSTNVVTGLIKANITNRIAFNVASGIDSRVILDTPGAENLIGLGDLLLSKPELAKPQRIQGCFVSEDEIAAVVEKLKSQGEPDYHNDILKTNLITLGDSSPDGSGGTAHGSDDPLVWEAADIVVSAGVGSTSNLQRRLSVGYSRAGRIMDLLEAKGIVGPQNGSKPREVLVDALELETLKAFEEHDSQ